MNKLPKSGEPLTHQKRTIQEPKLHNVSIFTRPAKNPILKSVRSKFSEIKLTFEIAGPMHNEDGTKGMKRGHFANSQQKRPTTTPSSYGIADDDHPKRPLPKHLYDIPVQEVDPFVFHDTFCMIGRKLGKNRIFRYSASKSLFIFGPLNPVRKFACRIVYNLFFDIFIILVILTNCVTLAMDKNWEIGQSGQFEQNEEVLGVITILEYVYIAAYTLEMALKIIAKGFVLNKFSYLRNFWNVMDFIIIIFGYITITNLRGSQGLDKDLEFLSTLRVLRAIKTASFIPGLRMMINSLLKSVFELLEVLTLIVLCLMIFSLMALQLFMGKLKQKCVLIKNGVAHQKMVFEEFSRDQSEYNGGTISEGDPNSRKQWYAWVSREDNWLLRHYPFDEPVPCANESSFGNGRLCPQGYVCLGDFGPNYDHGWSSFDTFFSSMLTTFQILTTDFWERPYDLIMSTTNPFSIIFCIIVIFFGFFYLLNLMLAVVATSYEREYRKKSEIPLTKHQKLGAHRKASTFSFTDPAKLRITILTSYKKRTPSDRAMLAKMLRNRNDEDFMFESAEPVIVSEAPPNLHEALSQLLGHRGKDGGTFGRILKNTKLLSPSPNQSAITAMEAVPANVTNLSPMKTPPLENPEKGDVRKIPSTPSLFSDDTGSVASTLQKSARRLAETLRIASTNWFTLGLLKMKAKLTPVVMNSRFEVTITCVVLLNTVLFAAEHHEQPGWLDELVVKSLGFGNIFFTLAFAFEAAIKICALQKDYFTTFWNCFDLFIVVQSLVDLSLYGDRLVLQVFKPLRLLRIFKLAQRWITMKVLLNIIVSTFGALANLIAVLVIVLYMFAILGLKVVGDYYTKNAFGDLEDFPRWNWQNFIYAFMLVFRVVCGEWIEPMLECLDATQGTNSEYKCFFIFLPVFIIGNLVILNLFLALLLNSFDTEALNAKREEEQEAAGKADKLKKYVGMFLNVKLKADESDQSSRSSSIREKDSKAALHLHGKRKHTSNYTQRDRFRSKAKQIIKLSRKQVAEKMLKDAEFRQKQSLSTKKLSFSNGLLANRESGFGLSRMIAATSENYISKWKPQSCFPQKCWSVNCCVLRMLRRNDWQWWGSLRRISLAVVSHPVFEWVILALIMASSITLCFEDIYLERNVKLQNALNYINLVFTIVFILEMVLKWFALGLWSYFTSSWTLLDFFIVCISIVSYYVAGESEIQIQGKPTTVFTSLKALKALRALRPLRAISRWQGMKIVVNALMFAIPSIFNVLLVCLLFWLIFSIIGVQFFKGKFYRCVDNESGSTVSPGLVDGRDMCCNNTNKWSWINQYPNFDNVFQGYLLLFQVATFEGWMEAMQASVDAVEVYQQPQRDYNLTAYLFYITFIVFGGFFILNLFIGVIIDNFNRLKKQYEGNLVEALLTPNQLHYYTAMKQLGRKKPRKVIKRPKNTFLGLFYDISLSRRFEILIFILIFLNIFTMSFESQDQRKVHANILEGFNALFTTIFALEAMAKIIGLRHYYFSMVWNIFDFILVVFSITDIVLGEAGRDIIRIPPTFLRVVRVFRIGRVLRLVKAAKGIRKLLFALVVSLPALFNIGCLLALITFIYAVLGMSFFGGSAHNTAIDSVFNFDSFLRSCLLLLRLMTAAGWNDVLQAMTVITPFCGNYRNIKCGRPGEGKCPSHGIAIMYIVSYIFISFTIVLNMYTAVILENFYEANRDDEIGIVEDDIEAFYVRWSRYDPQATQFIAFDQLSEFIGSLDPPLGLPLPNIAAIVAFNLPIARGNKIHCLDVLHALIKHNLGHIEDTEEFRKLQDQMEHRFRKQFPTRKLLDVVSSTRVWKIQHNAAVTIQRAWRAYQANKNPILLKRTKKKSKKIRGTKPTKKMMGNLLHLGHGALS